LRTCWGGRGEGEGRGRRVEAMKKPAVEQPQIVGGYDMSMTNHSPFPAAMKRLPHGLQVFIGVAIGCSLGAGLYYFSRRWRTYRTRYFCLRF